MINKCLANTDLVHKGFAYEMTSAQVTGQKFCCLVYIKKFDGFCLDELDSNQSTIIDPCID